MPESEFTVNHYDDSGRLQWSHAGYARQFAAEVAAQWAIDYGPTTRAEIVEDDSAEVVAVICV